jgi:hypothetical protein
MEIDTAKLIREALKLPEEPLTILKFAGIQSCPLDSSGDPQGIANCPIGFDHREKLPSEPEPWMRGLCEDDTWREKWRQILAYCQQCKRRPLAMPEEAQHYGSCFEILVGGEK